MGMQGGILALDQTFKVYHSQYGAQYVIDKKIYL